MTLQGMEMVGGGIMVIGAIVSACGGDKGMATFGGLGAIFCFLLAASHNHPQPLRDTPAAAVTVASNESPSMPISESDLEPISAKDARKLSAASDVNDASALLPPIWAKIRAAGREGKTELILTADDVPEIWKLASDADSKVKRVAADLASKGYKLKAQPGGGHAQARAQITVSW